MKEESQLHGKNKYWEIYLTVLDFWKAKIIPKSKKHSWTAFESLVKLLLYDAQLSMSVFRYAQFLLLCELT